MMKWIVDSGVVRGGKIGVENNGVLEFLVMFLMAS